MKIMLLLATKRNSTEKSEDKIFNIFEEKYDDVHYDRQKTSPNRLLEIWISIIWDNSNILQHIFYIERDPWCSTSSISRFLNNWQSKYFNAGNVLQTIKILKVKN